MASKSTVALDIKSNGATKCVNDIKSIGDRLASIGKIAKGAAIGNLLSFGIQKGIGMIQSFAAGSLDAYQKQEQAEANLGASLKATGYAAGFTQRQLEDYASQLQDMTTYGDEVTIQTMAMLSSFKNIKGDYFKQAQVAAMDMATVMGKSLPEATKLFGASLNNPIEGISKLKKSGIQFTEKQIAEITRLTNTGKLAAAQSMILAEAQKRWGGAAEAAAKTATGQMQQVQNAAGDIKEGLAGIALNVFTLGGAGSSLSKKMGEWASYLKDNMHQISYTIATVALQIGSFAEKIWVLFQPVWSMITTGIKNIVSAGQWLYENWSKIWDNMGDIAIAVAKDVLHGVLIVPKMIITSLKEVGTAIWDIIFNPSEAGDRLSKMLSNIGEKAMEQFADIGKNTENALAKAGVTELKLEAPDLSGWTETAKKWAEIDKRYAGYQSSLDKGLAAAEDAKKAKSITPPEIRKAAQTEDKNLAKVFAGLSEKGSSDAWKTILANQRGKPDVAEKQLETQQGIKAGIDKIADGIGSFAVAGLASAGNAIKSTFTPLNLNSVFPSSKYAGAEIAKAASVPAAADPARRDSAPEKQLKITGEIRDSIKEITNKIATVEAFAL